MKVMQNIKTKFLLIALIPVVSGCAQLSHLDQLLTLKAISDNRSLQHKFVEDQDKKFTALLAAIKDNSIQKYPDKKRFVKRFGVPIMTQASVCEGKPAELWLYRYAVKYFSSEKVYLYFDAQDKVLAWELIEPEKQEVSRK